MPLEHIQCTDFRCLETAELVFEMGNNLIVGVNAAGKTSILEAIAYLGRGRSFRGASTRELVRHGREHFVLFGRAVSGSRHINLGVRNGPDGLEVQTDNEKRSSAASLAEALPLQVIDPEVHKLVAGSPDDRRRYIDWMAFHVEHGYLELWRRYRRALRQRNAALRSGAGRADLGGWDHELATLGIEVDAVRKRMLNITRSSLQNAGEALLGAAIDLDYYQGWSAEKSLPAALDMSFDRDLQSTTTNVGPHRADIRLKFDERVARKLVSRGQQKMLACALVLSATDVVQTHLEKPLLLLLDDPAAELDKGSVLRLMEQVRNLGSQVVATALDRDTDLFTDPPRLFHVEQGQVRVVN